MVKVRGFQQGAYLAADMCPWCLVKECKGAAISFQYIGYNTQQRGFTAAIGAQYAKYAAFRHIKRHSLQGLYAPVTFGDLLQG